MSVDLYLIVVIFITFFIAGGIKGVVGLGLPPLVLGVITAIADVHSAMAVVALPALLTNIIQALKGPYLRELLLRNGLFFFAATFSVLLGSWFSTRIDVTASSVFLGGLLMAYALIGMMKVNLNMNDRLEPAAGITLGTFNGIFTGITGSSAVPGVLYLQSIGLDKDRLIQSMGILFSLSSVMLSITLLLNGILTVDIGVISVASLLPALLGMSAGAAIRDRISPLAFRRLFYLSLLILGTYIVANNLLMV